jgi:glycerol uptake facilitator-like aquaporin
MNIQAKHIAEAFGTFILAVSVALSAHAGNGLPLNTAVLAALIVGIFVFTIGSLSGTHLNPAVTLAQLAQKRISQADAMHYIAAQMIGGIVAGYIVLGTGMFRFSHILSFEPTVFIAEIFGAMVLMFGIASVVLNRVQASGAPYVIGGSLLAGVMLALLMGGIGIINPAVAIALGELTLATLFGPVIGATIGMYFYSLLVE